ncbi:Sporulation domain-containing protein [Legionella lansingensis]|uniref:Sporulation domain-containing protein n=1 Tax=Legionella lansingensis TaxID=45067 RepID=A0A0W0VKV7_9GAMM|nr:SPOR domain-containing protein [Legionella lansingensis]KTD20438.1 Sporulation domain-containing protein [Legionella lansingensis]SNV49950.1 Sporulation domain-containing protein [Legionella lansingensis]
MKFTMDERVKHRLIGLAVILSIAAIFAPAIIKKSNQRIGDNVSVSVKLPPKPTPPKVAIPNEKAMFETVKVARVEIPEVPASLEESTLSKAQSLSELKQIKEAVEPMVAKAKTEPAKLIKQKLKPTIVAAATKSISNQQQRKVDSKPVTAMTKPATVAKKAIVHNTKGRYAVQLATFAKQQNADSLLSKLRAKGYNATYYKVNTRLGPVYKVIVGQGNQKEEAKLLQQQLASVMQIKGFIVTTGVS